MLTLWLILKRFQNLIKFSLFLRRIFGENINIFLVHFQYIKQQALSCVDISTAHFLSTPKYQIIFFVFKSVHWVENLTAETAKKPLLTVIIVKSMCNREGMAAIKFNYLIKLLYYTKITGVLVNVAKIYTITY